MGNTIIKANIIEYKHMIQLCYYFCVGFIDFMFTDKILLDYNHLFCLNENKKIAKIIFSIT